MSGRFAAVALVIAAVAAVDVFSMAGAAAQASSTGIAALYPGDLGIENHPAVVFVEKFEENTLTDLFSRWTDILNGAKMSFNADVPAGSPGARSLNISWVGGGVNNGGHLYRQLNPAIDDTLYVRYYIKYPTDGHHHHEGMRFSRSETRPSCAMSQRTATRRYSRRARLRHGPAPRFRRYS